LTGDPAFRNNLRQLVNGLSTLVSSTEQMQQQVQIADTLDSFKTSVNKSDLIISTPTATQEVMIINTSPAEEKSAAKKPEITISSSTSISSQARLLKQLRDYKEQQNKLEQSKQEEKTGFKLTTDN
jgi:phospholipid/cholesterol/gamma-HCH transport system substrate-binding protein